MGVQLDKVEEEKPTEEEMIDKDFVKLEKPDPTAEADEPKGEDSSLAGLQSTSQKSKPITSNKDLMAIPRPGENIQKTFVGILSSETANKLQAMFRENCCPEIVPLTRGTELKPECRLVICCLPKNTRQMYLNSSKVFTKLIEDAGSLQAMVLIIIFGEKKTPKEKLHDEKIYGIVLRQGRELYIKGRCQTSPLDNPYQDNPNKTENRGDQCHVGLPENIALVTVDSRPSRFQLDRMKKFVERAFTNTRVSDESVDHQH